jgi:hypothetical protein
MPVQYSSCIPGTISPISSNSLASLSHGPFSWIFSTIFQHYWVKCKHPEYPYLITSPFSCYFILVVSNIFLKDFVFADPQNMLFPQSVRPFT